MCACDGTEYVRKLCACACEKDWGLLVSIRLIVKKAAPSTLGVLNSSAWGSTPLLCDYGGRGGEVAIPAAVTHVSLPSAEVVMSSPCTQKSQSYCSRKAEPRYEPEGPQSWGEGDSRAWRWSGWLHRWVDG